MRIGIVLRTTRLILISSFVLFVLGAGCNAVVDFGGEFRSDGDGRKDAGARDGGDSEHDGSTDPERDGGGSDRDGSTPNDGSVNDAEVGDAGGSDGATNENDGSTSCPSQSEDCSNDEDDDCDGLRDCRDPDCVDAPICCKPNQIPETSCSGGIDNDCDTNIDCEDSDCASSSLCCAATGPEVGVVACADSRDNDCDGVTDCTEASCAGGAACCDATGDENTATACGDTVDNDCDGKKDCADPDCATTLACCTPAGGAETNCGDDIDDDCNGLIDCQESTCFTSTSCTCGTSGATIETSCTDGVDDDCDRDRDCLDRDCERDLACCVSSGAEDTPSACIDGNDNDCDGLYDCEDPDCAGQLSCCVVAPENTNESCSDTLDNDCDSKLNCNDDSCQGTTACCSPSGPENSMTACTDGTDNDCDGHLNCSDPDCAGIAACCGTGGGGTLGCCTPDGSTDVMQPNDGKDNECDGLIDIPQRMSAFPVEGLPSAGDEVSLRFAPEINPNATLQCRTRRVADLLITPWTNCPMSGATVNPFTADPSKPENNGVWQTEVRWSFPGGGVSDIHVFRYYVHSTLYRVPHCPPAHSDADWFGKAIPRLSMPNASAFKPNEDTFLLNPFIRVSYKTPVSSRDDFQLNGSLIGVDMWSLRRRFKLSADNKFLLITRNYQSTRTGSCWAGTITVHNRQRTGRNVGQHTYGCQAIVLNRAGAGVCLVAGVSGPEFQALTDSNDSYANALGWDKANKFMWRNLVDTSSTGSVNFTPKCADGRPCFGAAIFLPDRMQFPSAP